MRVFSQRANTGQKVFEVFIGLLCIAILCAVVWPVQAGHGHSPTTECLSQIKQLMTGTLIYSSDNDDRFPPYYTFNGKENEFKGATLPYIKNPDIYRCPRLKDDPESVHKVMLYSHSLSLKERIVDYDKGKRMLEISYKDGNAAKIPYLRDIFVNPQDTHDFRSPHGEGFSVTYLDGHAKIVKEFDKSGAL
jgi:prepilin-type processing-associated H-X9-DG protein